MQPPQTIFPPHIPGICFPKVNSALSLIQDLEDELPASSSSPSQDKKIGNEKPDYHHQTSELKHIHSNSKSLNRLKQIGQSCEPFLHKSNLYKIQLENFQSDAATQKLDKNSTYVKRKTNELTTLMKVYEMNYKYCVASETCPRRMNVLNRCFQTYRPEIVQSLHQMGRYDLICGKEKRAVERCVARQVMNTSRDTCT